MPSLKPGQTVPNLEVPTVGGGVWRLFDHGAKPFVMVEVYRGRHCPLCAKRLKELDRRLGEFENRDVPVLAVSMDDQEQAEATVRESELERVTVGYDLPERTARDWDLFLSTSIKEEEPRLFTEPGLFVIRPNGELHMVTLSSAPFLRVRYDDVLFAIDVVIDKDYPPRGVA